MAKLHDILCKECRMGVFMFIEKTARQELERALKLLPTFYSCSGFLFEVID
jgi:hypothetical protein